MKCRTSLCEALVVVPFYKKTQIEYSEYVENTSILGHVIYTCHESGGARPGHVCFMDDLRTRPRTGEGLLKKQTGGAGSRP